jgi:asparagine synthase (glutamine-hydrolysing)
VTYNGEIFNFREVRARLESKGYVFRTRSDTEVILHAYADRGDECVEAFRGMFAFAVWDRARRRLLLARDRLGIKPLYYALVDGVLLFASEIKALLQWPGFVRAVDPTALRYYLRYRYVPGPRTMFRGISKLQPGHLLVVDNGQIVRRPYWDLPNADEIEPSAQPERELMERLEECVRLRLVSDVPLGVFLSGGIDSSTIVGVMERMVAEPIRTFSIGYPDGGPGSEVTEFAFARMAAQRFHAQHRELELEPNRFWGALPRILWHFDEPVADPASVPLYFLSKFAREFVTVVLSGEGADEILAGYGIYRRMLWLERLRRFPPLVSMARLVKPAAGRKLGRYLSGLEQPLAERYRGVSSLFSASELNEVLLPEVFAQTESDGLEDSLFARCNGVDPLRQMLYFDLKVWLPDDLLVKADKMTMAASLELRVPFLDHKLVEWAWQLPNRLKIHDGSGKHLLRKAVAGMVPPAIVNRAKRGFPVPIRGWFQAELAARAREMLLDASSAASGFFRKQALTALLAEHEQGREDRSGEIYALVVFHLWHELFIASSTAPAAVPE